MSFTMNNNQDNSESQDAEGERPLRDYNAGGRNIEYDDVESHRLQHVPMYIGLHLPQKKKHRRHRHKKHDRTPKTPQQDSEYRPPSTPPSQRVQFILGQSNDDENGETATHELFCEMDELRMVGEEGELEWKEIARWVKFEEDVEEGGERWSKPHVATLTLHSLFELRWGILHGTVLLDMHAENLAEVADLVLDNMVATKQLEEVNRELVRDALLRRHRFQHEKKKGSLPVIRSLADIGKKHSDKNMHSTNNTSSDIRKTHSSNKLLKVPSGSGLSHTSSSAMTENESGADLPEIQSSHKLNMHFMKKLPPGAEASNILVGEVDFLANPIIAFVRLINSVQMNDLTEVPVPTRFMFILLGPTGNQKRYHEIGRSIATLMSDEIFHEVAYKAKNRQDLLAGIDEFLDQVTVLPPGEWDPNIRIEPPTKIPSQQGRKMAQPDSVGNGMATMAEEEEEEHGDPTLIRTGRIFGGLMNDVKRKAPFYLSDIKDALHVQSIASYVFLFFACLTPIITFGGLLGDATKNNMAAMESILAGAFCGVTYHLFSGQPLTIIGSTGPVLVFETILYHFCEDNHLDYLSFRFWIGLWTGLILIIMVAFDLSALVRYITRFTEESFASLIALIFIYEAISKLLKIANKYPVNLHPDQYLDYDCYCTPPNITTNVSTTAASVSTTGAPAVLSSMASYLNDTPTNWSALTKEACLKLEGTPSPGCYTTVYYSDVFFLSCLLFIGTFTLATGLKEMRNTRFFPSKVRSLISDFAVLIAIVVMVTTDLVIGLKTPKLLVPSEFRPTRDDRGWFVNPMKNPVWTIFAGILPALLATILIFMDQQITAVIVNRKEHKLKKGGGYHLDLFVIAIQIMICSIMGLPWYVAATVLSINHVRSLMKESETSAPGERPQFLGVREQRVTGVVIFLSIGLSVLITKILKYIPMPVLYGVFLYMGTSSLKGVQLLQRVSIMFMPPKYQPDYIFLRHVRLIRCHIFTAIQVTCLAVLWVIKTIKSISIVFPLMVLAMCFVRKALDYIFTQHELKWLDDIMPEAHSRAKEDAKKKKEKERNVDQEIEIKGGGTIQVPLKDGRSIHIPADKITYNPVTATINITDEMAKTAIWKQLVANESSPALSDMELKHRKKHNNGEKKSASREPVKFHLGEEETRGLIDTPEIVVDPPNRLSRDDTTRL